MNLIFLQLEIILFCIFFSYSLYYFFGKIFIVYKAFKNIVGVDKKTREQNITKIQLNPDTNPHVNEYFVKKLQISELEKNKIIELVKRIKINISKGEYDLAKNLIIDGLTIDKFNIDLNTELAGIYILEKDYIKAEYIYKDLLLVHSDDFNILKNLAYVLTIQKKYDIAIQIYKKAYEINSEDMEITNMLAHLYFFENKYLEAILYLKIFLKQNPTDLENLILLGASYKLIGKYFDSVSFYKKAQELDPYNEEIKKELLELDNLLNPPKENNLENIQNQEINENNQNNDSKIG